MNEMSFNFHGIEIFMRLGVVFWISRVHCILRIWVLVDMQDNPILRIVCGCLREIYIYICEISINIGNRH